MKIQRLVPFQLVFNVSSKYRRLNSPVRWSLMELSALDKLSLDELVGNGAEQGDKQDIDEKARPVLSLQDRSGEDDSHQRAGCGGNDDKRCGKGKKEAGEYGGASDIDQGKKSQEEHPGVDQEETQVPKRTPTVKKAPAW